MSRRRLALAAGAVALLVAAPTVAYAAKSAKPIVLVGKVGLNDAYTISLTKAGAPAQTAKLKHGAYTINVHDYSDVHNFRIKGPGLNKWTTVPEIGAKTWKVNLRKGVYTVDCDPHVVAMKFTFKVS